MKPSLRQWEERPRDSAAEELLCRELRLSPLMARLLVGRKFNAPDQVQKFLHPRLEDIPDPFSLAEMGDATRRILQAVQRREDVLIFGDYDVDGMTGTAQLALFLREIGLPVRTLLPHRLEDGYGLNPKTVAKILHRPPQLLITIDNGTNAIAEISEITQQDVDVIVIDHHETPSQRPPVVALLNPKRPDSPFEEKNIASAGIVFLLLMALRKAWLELGKVVPNLRRYLDLVALGTIADVVPLIGLNRTLVKYGLEELTRTTRPGLKALKEAAKITGPVTPVTVGFRLAPRLNAAGRMHDPRIALSLLMTTDDAEAFVLATQLESLNRERQGVEERMIAEAVEIVEHEQKNRRCLLVANEGWHLGVAGIVAARLVDRYQKPAIVIALEHGLGRGSARTVPEISIYEVLSAAQSALLRFGGHHAACGLAVDPNRIVSLSNGIETFLSQDHSDTPLPLWVDSFVRLQEIDMSLVSEISKLEPFGAGNPEPLFAAEQVRMAGQRIVGATHLKGRLVQGTTEIEAIGFGMARELDQLKDHPHRAAFCPQMNEWNGSKSIQLKIRYLESY